MCGRFVQDPEPAQIVVDYDIAISAGIESYQASWNVAPSQALALVDDVEGQRRLSLDCWGWTREWSPQPIINARIEAAAVKKTFQDAWRHGRCLIPASGFYEWRQKQPHYIHRLDSAGITFAGLRDPTSGAVTILTTAPHPQVAAIHDRMPVMLNASSWTDWLDGADYRPDWLIADADLQVDPVHPRVGAVVNNDKRLTDRFDKGEQTTLF